VRDGPRPLGGRRNCRAPCPNRALRLAGGGLRPLNYEGIQSSLSFDTNGNSLPITF
jgi:hypothetical protein